MNTKNIRLQYCKVVIYGQYSSYNQKPIMSFCTDRIRNSKAQSTRWRKLITVCCSHARTRKSEDQLLDCHVLMCLTFTLISIPLLAQTSSLICIYIHVRCPLSVSQKCLWWMWNSKIPVCLGHAWHVNTGFTWISEETRHILSV